MYLYNEVTAVRRYRGDEKSAVEVTAALDSRYSTSGGRLTIQSPQQVKDAGKYFCVASNEFGKIETHSASVVFGCKYKMINRSLLSHMEKLLVVHVERLLRVEARIVPSTFRPVSPTLFFF
jgi:hypothetical protein